MTTRYRLGVTNHADRVNPYIGNGRWHGRWLGRAAEAVERAAIRVQEWAAWLQWHDPRV